MLWSSTASSTPKVLSAQPIGAPVFKIRGWANNQLTKNHSFPVPISKNLNNFSESGSICNCTPLTTQMGSLDTSAIEVN